MISMNTDLRHIQGGSRVGEESSRGDTLLWWELKTCVFKGEDLRAGEVCTNLHGPNRENRRFILTSRERHDPFPTRALYATHNVVRAKNKVRALHRLEFVMMPHTGVGQRRDVFIIGDDSYGAFLLRARMISPTRLPRGIGYADNMPKRDIYFGFLDKGDTMEIQCGR